MTFILISLTVTLGFYMAWNIGANDVANSMADAVGSRSITIRNAIIAASICEFSGAVLVGSHVTDTIRKGIVAPEMLSAHPEILAIGMASALLGAAVWLHIASWIGMPVSTTHSIVGAIIGFGIVAAGWHSVHWAKFGQIVASWFISPIAGGLLAFSIFRLIVWLILGRSSPINAAIRIAPSIIAFVTTVMALSIFFKGLKHAVGEHHLILFTGWRAFALSAAIGVLVGLASTFVLARRLSGKHSLPYASQLEEVEKVFAPLVVFTSCCVAFAHGSNDVANAVGPLAAVVDIIRSGSVKMRVGVPLWVLILGGSGIVVGLATYGYRVMRTVGDKITQLTPSRGIAADVAAATTVLVCSRLKLPVSTTHTLVGAIFGVGLARGLAAVDRSIARKIIASWLITVPAAAAVGLFFFLIGRALLLR